MSDAAAAIKQQAIAELDRLMQCVNGLLIDSKLYPGLRMEQAAGAYQNVRRQLDRLEQLTR